MHLSPFLVAAAFLALAASARADPPVSVYGAGSGGGGGGGSGGTSSNFSSAFPAAGTAVGALGPGSTMVPFTMDVSGLDLNVAVVSSTLPTGAATQATLASILSNMATAANQTVIQGVIGAATAPTKMTVGGLVYNSSPLTLTTGQSASFQADANGYLVISPTNLTVAQGSTTSGQTGSLVMGAVTTSAPSYTTAQTSPLSLDTAGNLRMNCITGCGATGVAQGSTTSGQTMNLNGVATVTAPTGTYTTAKTNPLTGDVNGSLYMTPHDSGGTTMTETTNHSMLVTAEPAENHIGEVGGNLLPITNAITTTSATTTTGQAIGGLQTLSNAVRISGSLGAGGTSSLIQDVMLTFKDAVGAAAADVYFFNASPSGSTCTNDSSFILADADRTKVIGIVHVTDFTASNTATVAQAHNLAMGFGLSSSTSMYACVVARASFVITGTSNAAMLTQVLRN